jgi:hypothetical protein
MSNLFDLVVRKGKTKAENRQPSEKDPLQANNRAMPWTERRLNNRHQGEKEIERQTFVKHS